jgi:hypothetical protein
MNLLLSIAYLSLEARFEQTMAASYMGAARKDKRAASSSFTSRGCTDTRFSALTRQCSRPSFWFKPSPQAELFE